MEAPARRRVPHSEPAFSTTTVFAFLLALRLINALTIRTFFQPDEYYQSLEPALETAFGPEIIAWITWEWRERLRSSLHPYIFANAYAGVQHVAVALELSPHLQADILIATPKVVQAVFAALADTFTYQFACDIYGAQSPAALATLVLTVCSPWNWFALVRTLSNSLETTLTIIALRLWPWSLFVSSRHGTLKQNRRVFLRKLLMSVTFAAVACILRPTNIVVWASVSAVMVIRHGGFATALHIAGVALVCGTWVLVCTFGADFSFYDEVTFPPWRLIQFNLVQSLAVFYGQNRADYYLTEGIPLLLTTALPFAIIGLWKAIHLNPPPQQPSANHPIRFTLAITAITTITAFSFIAHKEVRFIFPLLPILHILAASPLATFFHPFPHPRQLSRRFLLYALLATNILIAWYTTTVHQRGVLDVMHFIRHTHEQNFARGNQPYTDEFPYREMSVAFLMPCHSTPWRSHLIYPEIEAWALTCEPPIGLTKVERLQYMDEADVFYADPAAWVKENMEALTNIDVNRGLEGFDWDGIDGENEKRTWPRFLVFFEQLEGTLKDVMSRTRYQECWRGFNSNWHDDWRRKGDVVVWCLDEK